MPDKQERTLLAAHSTLLETLHGANRWELREDGLHCYFKDAPELSFSWDALKTIHPKLPRSLKTLASPKRIARMRDNRATVGVLRLVAQFMYHLAPQTLVDAAGDINYVMDIDLIRKDDQSDLFSVHGVFYTVSGLCVNWHRLSSTLVKQAWLDETYPDWQSRQLIGENLGLLGVALYKYVLGTADMPQATSLPEIVV